MNIIKKKCTNCGKEIRPCNYDKHFKSCISKKDKTAINDYKINDNEYKCPSCGKIYCKNGIGTHVWRIHGEGINHNSNLNRNPWNKGLSGVGWNRGLTKETDERVKRIGQTYSNNIKIGKTIPSFKGKHHSEKTKKIISYKLSINNKGGRCKWYDYKRKDGDIVKLQGTWELRFARVLDFIDNSWMKIGANQFNKTHSFKWKDKDNREHFYTPDFYSPKLNKYFEVKGYWWGNDKEKMNQIIEQYKNIKLEIITKNKLEIYEKLLES